MTRRQRKYRRVAIGSVLTLVLALIIAMLTLAKMPSIGPTGSDKFFHVLAFASLAFPMALVRPRLAIWVLMAAVAYGGTIELIQPLFGRQAEWADLVADGIGAAAGAIAARHLGYRLRQSRWRDHNQDTMTDT